MQNKPMQEEERSNSVDKKYLCSELILQQRKSN